ncbi:hypothetical protein BGZ94_006086 [Podila epigama]|nr:hypothetical protein BGZ94_006086 [Podila epigama]
MSHATNNTAPGANTDIHAALRSMQEHIQRLQEQIQRQQDRIQQLEASTSGRVANKRPRATTLKISQELLEKYPAIGEAQFFDSELPKNHSIFNWKDYHYTEGMKYNAPPVLQHSEVSLPGQPNDTIVIWQQSKDIWRTQPGSTTLHECLRLMTHPGSAECEKAFRSRHQALKREGGVPYYFERARSPKKKAASELVRKTYKKYEPLKKRTKKPDNKTGKEKSGSSDKPKDKHWVDDIVTFEYDWGLWGRDQGEAPVVTYECIDGIAYLKYSEKFLHLEDDGMICLTDEIPKKDDRLRLVVSDEDYSFQFSLWDRDGFAFIDWIKCAFGPVKVNEECKETWGMRLVLCPVHLRIPGFNE